MSILKKETYQVQMPEVCRQRLLGYAESFQELAGSLAGEFCYETADRQILLEERRLWENRQMLSSSLNEVSQIMERVANEVFCYEPVEEHKRRMLMHALRLEGIKAQQMCYMPEGNGRRILNITLSTDKKGGIPVREVADILSILLKKRMQASMNSPYLVEASGRSFLFMEEAKYIAMTGLARVVKETENISGDQYSILESEKGKMTILLSDGTGSGEKASQGSEWALELMEKLLEADYDIETAAELLNTALYARGEEGDHPTLDVCCLDLYAGACDFCKVGGAASFLKRGRRVEVVSEGSLPLGIFQQVEPRLVRRELRNGDYVVLLTDGVLDALAESGYEEAFSALLGDLDVVNPGEMAEQLLQRVLCRCGGHVLDDMTILVAGVWKNTNLLDFSGKLR